MNIDRYKRDLKKLSEQATRLFDDLTKNKEKARIFHSEYQKWYTESQEVIRQILPNRHQEFDQLYNEAKRKSVDSSTYTIKDWLLGIRAAVNEYTGQKRFEDFGAALMRFQSQISILGSAESRFDSSLFDIRALLQADLFDNELDAAEELKKKGFLRAAGALAGVVLEAHLREVCATHGIAIKKAKPTIADYNDALKNGDVIDVPVWRSIQFLADIRNLCDHKKGREPKEQELADLIDGVRKISKTIF